MESISVNPRNEKTKIETDTDQLTIESDTDKTKIETDADKIETCNIRALVYPYLSAKRSISGLPPTRNGGAHPERGLQPAEEKRDRSLEILGGDKDRQLHTLWKETNIGKILPWDDIEEEAEELIAKKREGKQAWSRDKTVQRLASNEMTN